MSALRWLLVLAAFAHDGARGRSPHAIYAEVLGKGGLGGLGYDCLLGDRLALGAAVSFYPFADGHVLSISPYLGAYPLGTSGSHRWFVHVGPQLLHVTMPSSVPEWRGAHRTGVGAEVSAGYEVRGRGLLRLYGMGTSGAGGLAPWPGASLGWAP